MKFSTIVLSVLSILSFSFGLYQKDRADKLEAMGAGMESVDESRLLSTESQLMEAIMQTQYASTAKLEVDGEVIAVDMALKAAEITPN